MNNFKFMYCSDYLSLGWVGDVLPQTIIYGELSNHMMDWIRAWFNCHIEDIKSYVCNPYLNTLLSLHVRGKNLNGVEVHIKFLHDKYTAFPPLYITIPIVPYTCRNHQSVYKLWDRGFFYFDSMPRSCLHSNVTIHTFLVKMWATKSGCAECLDKWLQTQSPHVWMEPSIPKQNSGWACGFYVLRNIMYFAEAMRHRPQSLGDVSNDTKQLDLQSVSRIE